MVPGWQLRETRGHMAETNRGWEVEAELRQVAKDGLSSTSSEEQELMWKAAMELVVRVLGVLELQVQSQAVMTNGTPRPDLGCEVLKVVMGWQREVLDDQVLLEEAVLLVPVVPPPALASVVQVVRLVPEGQVPKAQLDWWQVRVERWVEPRRLEARALPALLEWQVVLERGVWLVHLELPEGVAWEVKGLVGLWLVAADARLEALAR